ncbi:hypothetical protein [Chitinophaga defluvii]|uniref:Uncharacterized protein n=1 Tax=Chitinophaga defluvii TaxID=3163343 RepID=A0ABV2T489_9BACT
MQRKYSLEWFDLLVNQTLPAINSNPSALDAAFVRQTLTVAVDEKVKIRLALLEDMFNTRDEMNMQVLINRYQILLIHLLDMLSQGADASSNSRLSVFLYKKLQQCLAELLAFIENDFLKYFDLEQRVPESYHTVCRDLITKELPLLEKKLYDYKQDPVLVDLVLNNLRSFASNDRVHLPYRIFFYLKAAWFELRNSSLYEAHYGELPLLDELLLRINYNTPLFTNYFVQHLIKKKQSPLDNIDDKIKLLHNYKRMVNEVVVQPTGKLMPDLPGIVRQIIEQIDEEIQLLHPVAAPSETGLSNASDYKVQTTLSVPILAAIFRVFKETGAIQNGNVKKLLEFVATHYTSMKSDQISYTHLHSSYYDIDPKNKQRLYDLLVQLANNSKRM